MALRINLSGLVCAFVALGGAAMPTSAQVRADVTVEPIVVWETDPRGWLGVQYEFLREFTFGSNEAPRTEVRIDALFRGAAAHRAGLRAGDVVEGINGMAPSEALMWQLAREIRPGDTVQFALLRGQERLERWVVADARPGERRSEPRRIVGFVAPDPPEGAALPKRFGVEPESFDAPEGFTIVWQGGSGQSQAFTYRFQAPDRADVPFGAFVVRTPATDSLMTLIRIVQNELSAAVMVNAREARERARVRRVELSRELDELQHELALVSREGLRLSELGNGSGEIHVRVSPRTALAPLVRASRAFLLGAEVTSVSGELGQYFGVDSGVLVSTVFDGTPADRAGLRPGDVIVATSRGTVHDFGELRQHLVTGGTNIELTVVRSGEERTVRFPEQ